MTYFSQEPNIELIRLDKGLRSNIPSQQCNSVVKIGKKNHN
jgi:hypothetical protein